MQGQPKIQARTGRIRKALAPALHLIEDCDLNVLRYVCRKHALSLVLFLSIPGHADESIEKNRRFD
jgi:hypothetical protein